MGLSLAVLRNGYCALRKRTIVLFLFMLLALNATASASHHYTEKQLDALAARVGKTFWIISVNNWTPSFLSAPAPDASSFRAQPKDSFEITELIGRKAKNPYYRVKFGSGKEGYIRPEAFHEEFNVTILTIDPQADEKRKAVQAAEEEKQRLAWIQVQPWTQAVKEAAIKRQAVPGMSIAEVKKVLGNPSRVAKVRGQHKVAKVAEEHWFYPDGSVLVFYNGLLNRVEPKQAKEK